MRVRGCWCDLQQARLRGTPYLHVLVAKRQRRRSCVSVQVGHLEVLGLNRLRLAVMEEGVLGPVGGADGGFGHMVDGERQRRKFSHKVQLKQRNGVKVGPEAPLQPAPTEAGPHLKGLCGGAARLRPHSRDLHVHRSPGFCLHHSGVCGIDEDADDGRPELLRRVEDDQRPETPITPRISRDRSRTAVLMKVSRR